MEPAAAFLRELLSSAINSRREMVEISGKFGLINLVMRWGGLTSPLWRGRYVFGKSHKTFKLQKTTSFQTSSLFFSKLLM